MSKILVTGGGGFLGKAITDRLLSRGDEVTVLQRSESTYLQKKGVRLVTGSLTDSEAVRSASAGCDGIIHTAAKAGVWGKRKDFFSTNFDGTKVLLEAAIAEGIRTFVHCSTPSVVFSGEAFEGQDETLPYGKNWLCDYAESKAEAEKLVLDRARSGAIDAVALRPHLIFGKGDPHLLPRVIERSRSGRLRRIGDGTNKVDVTAVSNAADAHIQAFDWLKSGSRGGGAYFLSQGKPVNLWNWINGVLKEVGVPLIEKSISLNSAYRIGAVCEFLWRILGKEDIPPMTRFVAVELAKSHWFSIESAKRDFGYSPQNNSTEDALAEFLSDVRDNQQK